VVIGHAIQANLLEGETSFVWSNLIFAFQMPLLFFISGYAAGFSFPSYDSMKFIKKKAGRLFVTAQ
jgi:fucose 4-O-acetylase-like acetyltransferase